MLETIPKLQEIDEDETPIPGATLPQNQHELIYISVGPNDFAEIDELLGISSYNRRQRSKACVFY